MAVIAHFGTFDVENYGDLLFPAILEHRLGDLDYRFVHVSPHGGPPVWNDCVTTVAAEAMINDPPELAGVVVGGGHIIHASPSSLDRYDQGGLSEIVAYPSLWLGAAYIAAQRNVPYCWNAPGVPQAFSPSTMRLVEWAASIADYLAVRDRASHSRLVAAGVTRPIRVVPDTALEVARLWSPQQLEAAYSEAFCSRGREVPERTIAVHLNRRYAGEDLDLLAGRLDRIAQRLEATPVLIAMGPCHGDDELQRDVGRRMASEPLVIDRPQSLREITACIARGEAYLGSSLHGMITACSFGTRGMVVIPRSAGTIGKFTGFLEMFQLTRWRAETWQEAEDRLEEFIAAPPDPWARVLDAATPTLDEHWERMRGVLSPPAEQRHDDSTLVNKQGAIDRLTASSNGASWDSMLYAPIIAEQAMRASQHRKAAREERSQKANALAEGERLRTELAGAREQHQQVVAALRAEADEARLAVEDLRAERDGLLREAEHLRAAIEGAVQLDTENADLREGAELRLAQVAALLVQLAGRVSTKRGKRLLEAAQQEVYRVHEELSQVRKLTELVQTEGAQPDEIEDAQRDETADDPNRILPGAPAHGSHSSLGGDRADDRWAAESGYRITRGVNGHGTAAENHRNEGWRADIIICVHNALEDVMRCLRSVARHTDARHRVIVIDDGSDAECAGFLRDFADSHSQVTLLRNEERLGYTKAANQGLRESSGEMVVLLNSDTIVPPLWLDRLVECAQSDSRIGIVGPLSNAASYQSVPERFDSSGDWAVNPLPFGWDIDQVAAAVADISDRTFPRVPFVNGFCYAITRAVIEAIGYFDEENFPDGYGEENEYSLRAADAGFELAIADHAYVYHAKSRSYSHERRRELGKAGRSVLLGKYGTERLEAGQALLRDEPTLAKMRLALGAILEATWATSAATKPASRTLSVLFLVPVSGGGGGVHSVVQEAAGMRRLGINAQVAVQAKHLSRYQEQYPTIGTDRLFFGYSTLDELMAHASDFAVVIGTIHVSMPLVAAITAECPWITPAYYVQDYEPLFYPKESAAWEEAARSYTLVPNAVLFAKTRWLCDIVRTRHGVEVHKVCPSIDHDVYFPSPTKNRGNRVRIVAMIRPSSPRRGPGRTMEILRTLVREFGRRVDVRTFGCTDEAMHAAQLSTDFRFTNHGTLTREQVAQLLRDADIFLDLSDYQAFGRTGLEAMACGCAVVVPMVGGADEYALDRENALMVDTSQVEACYAAARELVTDPVLRERLQQAGVAKAGEYSIDRAARSELELFSTLWNTRRYVAADPSSAHSVIA
jgi:GT2 family glycosyltransferase/glycosyltransferase involved in cell wall biosynthesis/polysaccharide pyruvyl transferase WcaK-like protein